MMEDPWRLFPAAASHAVGEIGILRHSNILMTIRSPKYSFDAASVNTVALRSVPSRSKANSLWNILSPSRVFLAAALNNRV